MRGEELLTRPCPYVAGVVDALVGNHGEVDLGLVVVDVDGCVGLDAGVGFDLARLVGSATVVTNMSPSSSSRVVGTFFASNERSA